MSHDMVGMDIDAISLLREQLLEASRKVQASRLRTTARVGLSRMVWHGPDQRRFEQDIHHVVLPALRAAAAAMDAAAEGLARQIGEQQTTSAAGTGAIGTKKKIEVCTESQAFPSRSSFHGKNLTPEGQRVAVRAELSDAVSGDKPLPDGYHRASDKELSDMGIDPKSLKTHSGLNAAVFRGPDGKWFLAFEGTKDWVDWGTNIQGLVSATDQHTEAVILARKLHKATNGNLEFIGHSLGGGVATAASVATGAPATTFNAAGLGPENFAIALLAREGQSDFNLRALTKFSQAASSIMLLTPAGRVEMAVSRPVFNFTVQQLADVPVTNYKTSTDPLSGPQDETKGLIGQKSLGTQVSLPTDIPDAHDMAYVDKAIIDKYGVKD